MRRLSLLAFLAALSLTSVALLSFGVVRQGPPAAAFTPPALAPDEPPTHFDPAMLSPAPGMRFGIDANSIDRFQQQAGPPDYATIWVGKWNIDHGWKDTGAALQKIQAQGVTPAIHFYYWGDDMGRACLWNGCNGKDRAGWDFLAQDLVWHLDADLKGGPALVILESEFNKRGVETDEGLDELLSEKASYIRANYPAAKVVLGLGNWYPQGWGTWDRAAASSDYVGLQALAGSTHDSTDEVLALAGKTLEGVQRLRELFGKPVIVQDVAVSSYPEPDNLETQGVAIANLAEQLPRLKEAGVEAVLYRTFLDSPTMALHNHYAEAERHWGLAWHDTGELKPAGQAWMAAVQKARQPEAAPADVPEVAVMQAG
ncbi:MAG TPA: hypothetical protein VM327_05890 [Candidatus Thermoplasmatota archaeon]|nr:hypothetical protein [Candidatus Thermoplasmatota archaeon]